MTGDTPPRHLIQSHLLQQNQERLQEMIEEGVHEVQVVCATDYECPACASDYSLRGKGYRLSPLRSFRTGFAKTTQLLATELFDLLRLYAKKNETSGQPG